MKKDLTKSIFKKLLCALAAFGLGWIAVDIFQDLRRVAGPERTPLLAGALLCVTGSGIAALIGLNIGSENAEPGIKRLSIVLRDLLISLALLVIAAALITCVFIYVAGIFQYGKPPFVWGRVGGALTDWVIDLLLFLPLIVIGAIVAVVSLVERVRAFF